MATGPPEADKRRGVMANGGNGAGPRMRFAATRGGAGRLRARIGDAICLRGLWDGVLNFGMLKIALTRITWTPAHAIE